MIDERKKGGRVVRWCWVNFSAGASYNLITVGQGPIAPAVGAGGGGLDIFTLSYLFSSFSLSLGDGPISTEILSQRAIKPQTTNQPTIERKSLNQHHPHLLQAQYPLAPI